MNCTTINNISPNCEYPLVGNVSDTLIIMNAGEIVKVTWSTLQKGVITNITLKPGAIAVAFEGFNNSVEPQTSMVRLKFGVGYGHRVDFLALDNSAVVKKTLEALAAKRLVAVVQNNHKGQAGASAFEVYGLNAGLMLTRCLRVLADEKTQGAYQLTLQTTDQSPEPHLPVSFFDTDFLTTQAKVMALIT